MHCVQLSELQERIETFEGAVAVRHLDSPLASDEVRSLIRFVEAVHGLPFNDNIWEAGRALRRKNRAVNGSRFFCSELVAAAYQRIALIEAPPAGYAANNFIPADFSVDFPESILRMRGHGLSADQVVRSDAVLRERVGVST